MKKEKKPRTKIDTYLDLVEDALQKGYIFQCYRPHNYDDIITFVAKKNESGICTNPKDIYLIEYMKQYSYLLELLNYTSMQCEVSYNKRKNDYKISIVEPIIKGLSGQDEYVTFKEKYTVCGKSIASGLSLLEGELAEKSQVNNNSEGKKKILKKQ